MDWLLVCVKPFRGPAPAVPRASTTSSPSTLSSPKHNTTTRSQVASSLVKSAYRGLCRRQAEQSLQEEPPASRRHQPHPPTYGVYKNIHKQEIEINFSFKNCLSSHLLSPPGLPEKRISWWVSWRRFNVVELSHTAYTFPPRPPGPKQWEKNTGNSL